MPPPPSPRCQMLKPSLFNVHKGTSRQKKHAFVAYPTPPLLGNFFHFLNHNMLFPLCLFHLVGEASSPLFAIAWFMLLIRITMFPSCFSLNSNSRRDAPFVDLRQSLREKSTSHQHNTKTKIWTFPLILKLTWIHSLFPSITNKMQLHK